MNNLFVSDHADKIFVRSRMELESVTANLMRCKAFLKPKKVKDYHSFRATYFGTFEEDVDQNIVSGRE